MRKEVETAVALCELAERALDDVDVHGAITYAGRARRMTGNYADALEASIFVRATAAEVDALSLSDQLARAEELATVAVIWSHNCEADGRTLAVAYLKWHETREMQRRYVAATSGFTWLESHLPDEPWAASIKMRCANHMLSIGVHNADVLLAERGVECGSQVRHAVADPDEVSAWLQWRGLYEARRYRPEAATNTLAESFELRAQTKRRQTTRRFLEAELAFFESDTAGVARLSEAVRQAEDAGLVRHARVVTRHMQRHFL